VGELLGIASPLDQKSKLLENEALDFLGNREERKSEDSLEERISEIIPEEISEEFRSH
jgi:hypothetical protein